MLSGGQICIGVLFICYNFEWTDDSTAYLYTVQWKIFICFTVFGLALHNLSNSQMVCVTAILYVYHNIQVYRNITAIEIKSENSYIEQNRWNGQHRSRRRGRYCRCRHQIEVAVCQMPLLLVCQHIGQASHGSFVRHGCSDLHKEYFQLANNGQ